MLDFHEKDYLLQLSAMMSRAFEKRVLMSYEAGHGYVVIAAVEEQEKGGTLKRTEARGTHRHLSEAVRLCFESFLRIYTNTPLFQRARYYDHA